MAARELVRMADYMGTNLKGSTTRLRAALERLDWSRRNKSKHSTTEVTNEAL